ncbi:MAG: SUMF1/EgtB/PvdO family nonheme iron enzyme [Deltaproteobacteria bacterium]|nr:SUMF1/EgtB/PvdO family nonheme iron enzyme [Deltaproteobacteria bacterium]
MAQDTGAGVRQRVGGRTLWRCGVALVLLLLTTASSPAPAGPAASETPPAAPDPVPMIQVPGGPFLMGTPPAEVAEMVKWCKAQAGAFQCDSLYADEMPQRSVPAPGFWLDRHEVTNTQYRRFMSATGERAPAFWKDPRFNADQYPVVGVTWENAAAYCRWAGKRLPTEAEWEKAARGPRGLRYPWGDSFVPGHANVQGRGLTPVESFPAGASPYGILDLAGNVWEWTQDAPEQSNMTLRSRKGIEPVPLKMLKGGGWGTIPLHARPAFRNALWQGYQNALIGFRCAWSGRGP